MTALPDFDTMYRAIVARDESYLGVFFVAVKTTGIFCKPGCPARTPHSKNVEFFASYRDAIFAGYRPCKKCKPLPHQSDEPDWVKELMAEIDQNPCLRWPDWKLRQMAVEPARARRYFKKNFGMTFQGYCRARRMGLALKQVRNGQDVFTTGLDHGFVSDSGFRDAFARIVGTPPSQSASSTVMFCRWIDTPLGAMLAAADESGLALLEFVDRRMLETQIKVLQRRLDCRLVPGDSKFLRQTEAELASYFSGKTQTFNVPLILKGTDFQVRVWSELLQIPYGQTVSYLAIAERLGDKNAVRAVGKANGDNRIAIIVPCHRVIKSDGALCGYGGGLWRKKRLLELESGQSTLC